MNALFRAFRVVVSAVILVAGMASCAKDTEVDNPYADWKGVNKALIDSIANVCDNPPEKEVGKWKKYLDYRISVDKNTGDLLEPYNPKVEDYVYVKFKNAEDVLDEDALKANGEDYPIMYSDTVMAAYQGFLVDGTRFDGNYYGTFDREVNDNFTKFGVSEVVVGWTTVLMHMKPRTKDAVEVYIPYQLGYGESGSGNSIPGKSVLKFEMYVDEVIKPELPK